MNETAHQEIQDLLGAYALNALDDVEHRRVERHLGTCADCANEVRLLRGAASELAWLAPSEDASGLPDRIARKLPLQRRATRMRVLAGVAAVAVAISGFLGANLVHERSVNSQLADVVSGASRRVTLSPRGGFEGRGVLLVAADKAALVLEDLPDAGKDRTYQLWGLKGGKPRSMTLVDGTERVVALFDWKTPADSFAVTIEPDGGSPVPTSDPVLLGT